MNSNKKEIIALALLVGILPPAWAVASPYMYISVGPIALIAAGIYGANGNRLSDARKITLGYLAGDLWGYISTVGMAHTAFLMVVRRWAIVSVVRPFASSESDDCTSLSLSLSSADVASSRIRIGGFLRKTLAMLIRCF